MKSPTIKEHILIVCLGIFLSAGANAQGSGDMLHDLDLPLMDGLTENREEAMLFDSPDGRIISAQASGNVDGGSVFDYYRVVLPSLGWKIDQDHQSGLTCETASIYCLNAIRDQEILTLNIAGANQSAVISYSLSPN